MRKLRGFKLRRNVVKIFKWIIRHKRKPTSTRYHLLDPPTRTRTLNPMSKIINLARCLSRGAKELCLHNSNSDPDYLRLDQDPVETIKSEGVPKGHLAVYVGESNDDTQRYLVPVIYFNHPLFLQLLKEAEEEYGFDQKGTITIPCHVEEFRYVQGMIDREKSQYHNHVIGCFRV